MENGQVQLVFDQVVHRVFKGAGLKLFLVVDHDHGVLVVVAVLEAGQADDSLSVCLILPNRRGNFGVFLQPQRKAKRRPSKGDRRTAARPGTNLSDWLGSRAMFDCSQELMSQHGSVYAAENSHTAPSHSRTDQAQSRQIAQR